MKTILQIEDQYPNRLLVERILEGKYHLLHAATGEEGIRLALESTPDLILLDMGLPDLDGQTVVTHLRQKPELKNTPIIAITAWPAETAARMAQLYGCDGCITKPINITSFADQIQQFFDQAPSVNS